MSDTRHDPGQQFVVDVFTHHRVGHSGYVYAHLFTDLASRQVYPVFTKSKLVSELTTNMSELLIGSQMAQSLIARSRHKPDIDQQNFENSAIHQDIGWSLYRQGTSMLME